MSKALKFLPLANVIDRLSGGGSSSKAAPAVPTRADPSVTAAGQAEAARRAKKRGRTILTSGLGDEPTVSRPTLGA